MNKHITTYQQVLNLKNAVFHRIDHEDAMVAVVYKITQPDGKPLILKICDRVNDYLREIHFLTLFADQIPVPRIVQIVKPDKHLHGAILMECLSGDLLQPNELSEPLAYEIGRSLATIHLNRLSGYGDPIQDTLSNDPKDYFTLKFEEGLAECTGHLPSSLIEKCGRYYHSHLDLLSSVDGPCVVHRDFRPGNLIVYDGKLQGVIDWAGARASFAEEDFCSLEYGEWMNNSSNKQSLLAGYANIRPIPKYHELISFLRLSKAIATIGFMVKRGTWTSIYQSQLSYLNSLLEKE